MGILGFSPKICMLFIKMLIKPIIDRFKKFRRDFRIQWIKIRLISDIQIKILNIYILFRLLKFLKFKILDASILLRFNESTSFFWLKSNIIDKID